MSDEGKTVEEEQATGKPGAGADTVTEEIKVQAEDLFHTINQIIREGTARRITILRNDRVLVDIPLAVGMAASVVLALQMPVLSSIVAVAALFGGCTVRIEREEPPTEA
ncbi:MAG: DUF4342 domain-containing protein [Anaerolineae bacterium]|jgi:hypothetical protein